jgi:hypothetical protein
MDLRFTALALESVSSCRTHHRTRRRTKESQLLTESTVERIFRELMSDQNRSEETFEKAEELLEEELRPESPLRHRLTIELEELRSLAAKD